MVIDNNSGDGCRNSNENLEHDWIDSDDDDEDEDDDAEVSQVPASVQEVRVSVARRRHQDKISMSCYRITL